MMRTLVSLFAALAVGLTFAGSTVAAGPTRIAIPAVEFDDPFVCGADPVIHVEYTTPFRLVTWSDAQGNVVRDATFGPGSRLVLSDVTTGRRLSGISPAVFRTTFAADGSVESVTVTGLSAAITLPGAGVILLDTGRIEWAGGFLGPTLAERGPHGWLGSDGHDAFCAWFRA